MAVEQRQVVAMERGEALVPSFVVSMDTIKERIEQLQAFVEYYMKEGEDYGKIPGTQKPTLLKPGAEKLCDVYGFAKYFEVTNRVEDWEKGFFHYEVKATLVSKKSGLVEAEGLGSCNTREKRYKNQDPYTLVNTVLKMAKKRALVDAVLSATRSSGIFTQDIEDLVDEDELPQTQSTKATSPKQTKPMKNVTPTAVKTDPIRQEVNRVYNHAKSLGFSDEQIQELLKQATGLTSTAGITKEQVEAWRKAIDDAIEAEVDKAVPLLEVPQNG